MVAPAAAAGAAALLDDARSGCKRIAKYLQRLRDVRAKRQAMQAALEAAGEHQSQRASSSARAPAREQQGMVVVVARVCGHWRHWHCAVRR